jgi:uncharacterized membrane protein
MNKELTPIEELIEYLNANHFVAENKYSRGALKVAISKATELLQSESTFIKKKEREAAEFTLNSFLPKSTFHSAVDEFLDRNFPI